MFLSCKKTSSYTLDKKYTDKPFYGDTFIEASIGEPSVLNPVLASDSASHDIINLVFNGLVKFDREINMTGDLAEKWEIEDEGKKIIFYLRKGVKWHDGFEFTAEDVKFTYDKYMDPLTKTAYRSLFEPVSEVKVIDLSLIHISEPTRPY